MSSITAADFTLFDDLFGKLQTVSHTYVTDTSAEIVASIAPAASACGVIIIVVYGILLMRGSIQAPLLDATYRALKMIVLLGIALNVGIYQSYIGNFFLNAPSAMASVMTGAEGTGEAHSDAITSFVVAAFNFGDKLWESGSALSFNFGPLFLAILVWVLMAALGAYAAFLFGLALIATSILLAIGPIFILLSIFESGKRFSEMWLQQLFNFGLISVLTSACLQFFLTSITTSTMLGTAPVTIPTSEIFYFVLFALIDILVLRQVMPIASGLAGGMALATQGAFGAASEGLGRAMGATVRRYTPNNIAERYRRNQRNAATWRRIRRDWTEGKIATAAKSVGTAASTAYKRKFEPNSISNTQ